MLIALLTGFSASAQVDDIKSASKSNSRSSGGDKRSSGGGTNIFFIFDMFRVIGSWQHNVLQKKSEIPGLVGFDLMAQAAFQPSAYYVVNPRVRGNWGIFSSDFRTNYLIEEKIGKNADLITYDWQIVQLNFITTKHVTVRVGTGIMKEGFADQLTFSESSISTNLMFKENTWGSFAEWRSAKDYNTGAVPRRELNLQVHRKLFDAGHWRGFVTGGFQFQRYYSAVNIWGIQFGGIFKFY